MKAISTSVVLLSVGVSFGQAVHSPDSSCTLTAYGLAPEQEQQLVNLDQRAAGLWAWWDSCPRLSRCTLDPSKNYAWGDSAYSTDDCSFTIRAAYGQRGAYFLCQLTDEQHVCLGCEPGSDTISIFTAKRSSQVLYGAGSDGFACVSRHQYPRYLAWLRIGVGERELLEVLDLNWGDTSSVLDSCNPGTHGDGFIRYNHITFTQAESLGVTLEPNSPQGPVRSIELRVSWNCWGGPVGPVLTQPSSGTRLAFTFAYIDNDIGLQLHPTALCWRNKALPYTFTVDSVTGDTNSVDCWGDILFGEPLDSAVARAGVRRPIAGHVQCWMASTASERYTVQGRRVGVGGRSGYGFSRVVLERSANGTKSLHPKAVLKR